MQQPQAFMSEVKTSSYQRIGAAHRRCETAFESVLTGEWQVTSSLAFTSERDELFCIPEGLKALKSFCLTFVFSAIFNSQHECVLDLVHGSAL